MAETGGEGGGERGHEQETRTGPIKVLGLVLRIRNRFI